MKMLDRIQNPEWRKLKDSGESTWKTEATSWKKPQGSFWLVVLNFGCTLENPRAFK